MDHCFSFFSLLLAWACVILSTFANVPIHFLERSAAYSVMICSLQGNSEIFARNCKYSFSIFFGHFFFLYHNLLAHRNRIGWGRARVKQMQRKQKVEELETMGQSQIRTHTPKMECGQNTCDNVHRMKHRAMVKSVDAFRQSPTKPLTQTIGAHCVHVDFFVIVVDIV